MSNRLLSTLGTYDFFGKSLPGIVFLLMLSLLLPAKWLIGTFQDSRLGSMVGIVLAAVLLGFVVGEVLHSVALLLHRSVYWFGYGVHSVISRLCQWARGTGEGERREVSNPAPVNWIGDRWQTVKRVFEPHRKTFERQWNGSRADTDQQDNSGDDLRGNGHRTNGGVTDTDEGEEGGGNEGWEGGGNQGEEGGGAETVQGNEQTEPGDETTDNPRGTEDADQTVVATAHRTDEFTAVVHDGADEMAVAGSRGDDDATAAIWMNGNGRAGDPCPQFARARAAQDDITVRIGDAVATAGDGGTAVPQAEEATGPMGEEETTRAGAQNDANGPDAVEKDYRRVMSALSVADTSRAGQFQGNFTFSRSMEVGLLLALAVYAIFLNVDVFPRAIFGDVQPAIALFKGELEYLAVPMIVLAILFAYGVQKYKHHFVNYAITDYETACCMEPDLRLD